MAYSIPEAWMFPWGYAVWIKQVPPEHPELEGDHGNWDVLTRTIWMDNSKPLAEKRGLLLHELDHAWNDFKLWAAQEMNVKAPEAYDAPETAEDT